MATIATLDELYTDFLDETGEGDTATLKAKFRRWCLRLNRTIQPFAGVEANWGVEIYEDQETYDSDITGLTDVYRLHDVNFLPADTDDEIGNWEPWNLYDQYKWEGRGGDFGVWLDAAKTLWIRPVPDADGHVKLRGEKILANLNYVANVTVDEVSTPEIAVEYHDMYVNYAIMRQGSADEDTKPGESRYAVAKREYTAAEEELRLRYIQKDADRHFRK